MRPETNHRRFARFGAASGAAAGILATALTVAWGPRQEAALPPLPQEAALPPLPVDQIVDDDLTGLSQLGLPETIPGVEQTPAAEARLKLGRRLFFDPILSADRNVSCASCHEPARAFASAEALPLGVFGRRCARNSPTLFNRALGAAQFWDGRAPTLEAQVVMPIENPDEMGLPLDDAVRRLAAVPEYRDLFAAAGAAEPDRDALAAALGEFVRRLVRGDSPIDRFRAAQGDLTAVERRGLWVFESKGRCWRCHSGPNFSDEAFHNTGVGAAEGVPEPGRFAITNDPVDRGRFKTPTLRMTALTAPYMHNGSLKTLEEVAAYYKRGGNPNAELDPLLEPVDLTDEDVAGLVAFLHALSRSGDETLAATPAAPSPPPAAPPPARRRSF